MKHDTTDTLIARQQHVNSTVLNWSRDRHNKKTPYSRLRGWVDDNNNTAHKRKRDAGDGVAGALLRELPADVTEAVYVRYEAEYGASYWSLMLMLMPQKERMELGTCTSAREAKVILDGYRNAVH